jgi:hypothetical protein
MLDTNFLLDFGLNSGLETRVCRQVWFCKIARFLRSLPRQTPAHQTLRQWFVNTTVGTIVEMERLSPLDPSQNHQIKAGENIKLQKTSQNPLPFPAPPFNHPQLTASSSRKEVLSAEKRPGILRGDHGPPGLRAEAVEEAVARQRSACSSTVCRLKVGGFEVCWENRHTTVN